MQGRRHCCARPAAAAALTLPHRLHHSAFPPVLVDAQGLAEMGGQGGGRGVRGRVVQATALMRTLDLGAGRGGGRVLPLTRTAGSLAGIELNLGGPPVWTGVLYLWRQTAPAW